MPAGLAIVEYLSRSKVSILASNAHRYWESKRCQYAHHRWVTFAATNKHNTLAYRALKTVTKCGTVCTQRRLHRFQSKAVKPDQVRQCLPKYKGQARKPNRTAPMSNVTADHNGGYVRKKTFAKLSGNRTPVLDPSCSAQIVVGKQHL
jgi:hypothetical protein